MNVLLLTRDFATAQDGGTPYERRLVAGLAAAGVAVTVLARAEAGDVEETVSGVRVVRVPEYPPIVPETDALAWALHMGLAFQERGAAILSRSPIDVVDAVGWHTAYAAVALRRTFGVPLVATLPSTQIGRRRGRLTAPGDSLIHHIEWWLAAEAQRVIVGSHSVRQRLRRAFPSAAPRIEVVRNVRNVALGDAARRTIEVFERAGRDPSAHRSPAAAEVLARQLRVEFDRAPP